MFCNDGVDGADGEFCGTGDGADGLAVEVASDDNAALVGVNNAGPASGPAAFASCVEAVAGFADDVASAVFGQGECQIKDEVAFGVFARGDPLEDLDRDTAGEQISEGRAVNK